MWPLLFCNFPGGLYAKLYVTRSHGKNRDAEYCNFINSQHLTKNGNQTMD
jgi:hypothetical protein